MILTDRQLQILIAIIEEYSEIASPVGSMTLSKLFNVSSATIRAEMAKLEAKGLVKQPHASAGRIPTDKGYRVYVNYLNDNQPAKVYKRSEKVLSRLSSGKQEANFMIKNAVETLAELTYNLGFATIGDQVYFSGISNLFGQPEFLIKERTQAVANLIDNIDPWLREVRPNESINVYIGNENPIGKSSDASLIISKFRSPYSDQSYIGILGPTRQSYGQVMHLVERTGQILEELLQGEL